MNFDPTGATLSWIPNDGPPVDLSRHVVSVSFQRVTEENFLDGWSRPIRLTLRGRSDRHTAGIPAAAASHPPTSQPDARRVPR